MTIEAALMLKLPRPGFCKTRLATSIGPVAASAVYSVMVHWQISQIPSDWRISIHFAPPEAGSEARSWLSRWSGKNLTFIPQVAGDLGARMQHAVKVGLQTNDAVVLMGGDCPGLDTSILSEVSDLLRDQIQPVLVPATDGGYVLLGLCEDLPGLFENIEWSTPNVLDTTISRAKAASLNPRILDVLEDIDDWSSLQNHRTMIYRLLFENGAPESVLNAVLEEAQDVSSVVDETNCR